MRCGAATVVGLLVVLASLGVAGVRLAAQGTAPGNVASAPAAGEKTVAPPATPEKREIRLLHADTLKNDLTADTYILGTRASGGQQNTYQSKDVMLYCDSSVYFNQTDSAIGSGHVKIVDPESTLTGERVNADFEKEIIIISGNVVMVTQKKRKEEASGAAGAGGAASVAPKADESKAGEKKDTFAEAKYKKTTTTCDRIEYHYADDVRLAYITGPLKAVQEDKTATADAATYREKDGMLDVKGNVRVVTTDGDEYRCASATVGVDDDTLEAQGIEGLLTRKKKESSAPPASTPAPAGQPAPPAASGARSGPTPPAAPSAPTNQTG